MRAVILAGGMGTRLAPYTLMIPKPLLPIGRMPIIEIISRQLNYYGFQNVTITLGYMSNYIKSYLEGISNREGLPEFTFFEEKEPMGTSGSLPYLFGGVENILVMNGDILTSLNLLELYKSHIASGSVMTMALRRANYKLPFGAITINEHNEVLKFEEKPEIQLLDNMGIYVFSRDVLECFPKHTFVNSDELVRDLIQAGKKVNASVSDAEYYWVDIGTHADYEKVNSESDQILKRLGFLKGSQK